MRDRQNRLRSKRISVRRLNGARHWRTTLDQYIWILLRANISPEEVSKRVASSLNKHRRVNGIALPTSDIHLYARATSAWRNDAAYLEPETREPRVLSFGGRAPSFESLIRAALPTDDPRSVLQTLIRHNLVARDRRGRLRLLEPSFVPRHTEERAAFLAIGLSSIEAFMGTLYQNLRASDPTRRVGGFQRLAVTEQFDLSHLREYDKFVRENGQAFLELHQQWLQKQEVRQSRIAKATDRSPRRRRLRASAVGIGVFGFEAR